MTWSSRASTGRPRARIGLAEMQGSEGGLIDGYALLDLYKDVFVEYIIILIIIIVVLLDFGQLQFVKQSI